MTLKTSISAIILSASFSAGANHTPPPRPSSEIPACYIQSKTGDRCLHQTGAIRDPHRLGQYSLYPCTDASNIHFSLVESQREKGYYFIRDEHSKRCIHQFGANSARLITQHTCLEGHANILWKLRPDHTGYFYLQAKHSGKCLYVDPVDTFGTIIQADCRDEPGALWRFTRARSSLDPTITVDPFESCLASPPPNSDL